MESECTCRCATIQVNIYCFLRGRPSLSRRYQASCFQLTLRQRISRRRGAIVPVIHVEIFSVNIYAKRTGSPHRFFLLRRGRKRWRLRSTDAYESNLSKQLTRKHDTVSCAVSFVSIADIPDSTGIICIKSITEVCSQRQFSCGGATYGVRYGKGKIPRL